MVTLIGSIGRRRRFPFVNRENIKLLGINACLLLLSLHKHRDNDVDSSSIVKMTRTPTLQTRHELAQLLAEYNYCDTSLFFPELRVA
jgi:hypothetical protein